ncbi:MAG: hypothetical protein K6T34_04620 [Thermoflavifilum sp.]|nr:hypothetical protein [Thermoflavifilum sp.]
MLYVFIGISVLPYFLPKRLWRKLQLSRSRRFYQKLYIHYFQRFTQNGFWVNRLRSQVMHDAELMNKKDRIQSYKRNMLTFEVYHWSCFLFFFLTCCYAFFKHDFLIAWWILLVNILYNIIPIFIQQYNRLRLSNLSFL